MLWGRIFSQAGNELSMLFPYTSFPAGNELILKLTKNTASGIPFMLIILNQRLTLQEGTAKLGYNE